MRKERRKFPRIPVSVEVGVKNGLLPVTSVRSHEISVEGIRLFLPVELPKDKVMELEINLPSSPVIARGKVVWTKEVEIKEGKFFQTGIKFTELKPEDKAKIEAFVRGEFWAASP